MNKGRLVELVTDPTALGIALDYLLEHWHPNDDAPTEETWVVEARVNTTWGDVYYCPLPCYVRVASNDGRPFQGYVPRFSPKMKRLLEELLPGLPWMRCPTTLRLCALYQGKQHGS